jgi:hypothetical protein
MSETRVGHQDEPDEKNPQEWTVAVAHEADQRQNGSEQPDDLTLEREYLGASLHCREVG